MNQLEDLNLNSRLKGVLSNDAITIENMCWHGASATNSLPSTSAGEPGVRLDAGWPFQRTILFFEEVPGRLTALPGPRAQITFEIEVQEPEGIEEDTRRTVHEYSNPRLFQYLGFEE